MVSPRTDNSPLPRQLVQLRGRPLLLERAARWTPACPAAGHPLAQCCMSPSLSGCLWRRIKKKTLVSSILVHLTFSYFGQCYFECENNVLCRKWNVRVLENIHRSHREQRMGRPLMISSLRKLNAFDKRKEKKEIESVCLTKWKTPYK